MKKIKILLIVLLIGLFSVQANEYVNLDFYNTTVNWTTKKIHIKVTERFPKIVTNKEDPDYNDTDATYNISDARSKSMQKAKEKINLFLNRAIESLALDHDFTIKKKVDSDERFRTRFNQFFYDDLSTNKIYYNQDQIILDSSISFTGKRGLLNYLNLDFNSESFPEFQEIPNPTEYTGLVLDARHLKARPALLPSITTDKGLDIFSYRLAKKNYAIDSGMVEYMTDPIKAMKSKRVGSKPYYVVALSSHGTMKTNFSIPTEDAMKLIAKKESRVNLSKCKIIILLEK